MAIKSSITVRLSRERIYALYCLYEYMISQFAATDKHERLLHAHMVDLYWRLEVILSRRFNNINLQLSEAEALAFCQFWEGWAVTEPLAKVTVLDIITKVDKTTKQPKALQHG